MDQQKRRELYASSNGDRWFLSYDAIGELTVIHQPNTASGSRISIMPVHVFLASDNNGPEHQALRKLIMSWIEVDSGISGSPNIKS